MKQRNLIPVVLAVLFLALPLYTAPDKPPQEVLLRRFSSLLGLPIVNLPGGHQQSVSFRPLSCRS